MLARYAVVLALAALAQPALAQNTCSWTGGIAGNWESVGNWSCNAVPGPTDHAIITGFAVATLNSNVSVGQFSLANGGELTGSGTLTVTGAMSWTRGVLRGTGTTRVAPGATLALGGDATRVLADQHQLVNEGTATWTGAGTFSNGNDGSAFVNRGTIHVSAGAPNGAGVFFLGRLVNEPGGTIRKTGDSTTRIDGGFDNRGAVAVDEGTLRLTGSGGTDSGTYAVAAGAVLDFGDSRTVAAAGRVEGAGTLRLTTTPQVVFNGTLAVPTLDMATVDNPTFVLNTDATVETFGLAVGALTGTGTLTVTGVMTWTTGTMTGTGTTRIAPGATLALSGDGTRGFSGGRQIVNEGAATWTGAGRFSNQNDASAFVNRGTFLLNAVRTDSNAVFFFGRFVNEAGGVVTRTDPGLASFDPAFFDNAGTVTLDAGTLRLGGFASGTSTGTFTVRPAARLELTGTHTFATGSVVAGTGAVVQTNTQVNGATVRPGGGATGVLAWNAPSPDFPYAPTAAGVLDVALGGTGAGQSDRVAVTGNAALGGTLRVRLASGFAPAVGDRFAVVTCSGTCSGEFVTLDLPPGLSGTVEVSARAAEFVVTAFVAGEEDPDAVSAVTTIHGVWPNPTAGRVAMRFDLAEAGPVRLAVFDALGREVAVAHDGPLGPGRHALALDVAGLPAGVYVVRLEAGGAGAARRLTVVR